MDQEPLIAPSADSLKKKAYDLIKKDIITCVLYPGQRIVLGELVERYQIGSTPIRDALHQLANDDFLVSFPRYGYIITPITLRDVNELFELRLLLEAPAAKFAAMRGSLEQLQTIFKEANFSYTYGERDSYENFLMLNANFHSLIAKTSGNGRLADLLDKLFAQFQRIFSLGLDLKDSGEEMREEHIGLAEAILKKDGDLAETICQKQILRSKERILVALSRLNFMQF